MVAGMLDADRLRSLFLGFFAERGHAILPSASLVPEGDPSVLFTTAGVHPLLPYLGGRPHPAGRLLADCQKCLRTTDIDQVGDATHLTFFEMLGNWSLGAYFKRESITWSHELLTRDDLLAIAPQRLWISVFAGNQATPADAEAARIWGALGIPAERIVYLGEEHNWWTLGPEGPCGPDTEVFVDTTGTACQRGDAGCRPGTCDCGRFLEVWNNVFMTFQRRGGQLLPLPQANVDTGMGLERMLAVLNGAASVYQTAPLEAIHQRIASLSPTGVDERTSHPELIRALRILTDHLRSAVFILGDQAGVLPSNQGRGYVLRRLIRRAVRACQTLRIQPQRWAQTAELVIDRYSAVYPELPEHAGRISNGIIRESERFEATLRRATAKLRREIARLRADGGDRIPAEVAFHLYDTDGLPVELTSEIAREAGLGLDVDGFERLFVQHRQRSRPQRDQSTGQAQP
jgi:alanyl-tRNA synthetase